MRYTTIVIYVREGDKVTPVRYSKFYGQAYARELTMSDLYAGHTSWVNEQVVEYNRRPARVILPVQMAA